MTGDRAVPTHETNKNEVQRRSTKGKAVAVARNGGTSKKPSARSDGEPAAKRARNAELPPVPTVEPRRNGKQAATENDGDELRAIVPHVPDYAKKAKKEQKPEPEEEHFPTTEEYLDHFNSIRVAQGRFPDMELLRKLEILDDVTLIFQNMGLAEFFMMSDVAYEGITQQFLATLEVVIYPKRDPKRLHGKGFGHIEFDIEGVHYKVSFKELDEIFGFERNGSSLDKFVYPRDELAALWETISFGPYLGGKSKTSCIRNPAIRYTNRVLASTFFSTYNPGVIHTAELELLGLGLKPLITQMKNKKEFQGPMHVPSLGAFFAIQMLTYRHNVWCDRKKKGARRLQNGWIVTTILRAQGFLFPDSPSRPNLIDEQYLSKSGFFGGKLGDRWVYNFTLMHRDGTQVLLPNRGLTMLDKQCNISFYVLKDQLYNPSLGPPMRKCTKAIPNKPQNENGPAGCENEEERHPERRMGAGRYHFDPYVWGEPEYHTKKLYLRVNTLQKWCKWQDKTIHALVDCVRHLKKKVKQLTRPSSPDKNSATSTAPITQEEVGESSNARNPEFPPGKEDWIDPASAFLPEPSDSSPPRQSTPSCSTSNPSYYLGSDLSD
ncbi:uncharacterized protein LOC112085505 [Eutrema salsugineum]|uniref:uncharacterized protein LOC112085505 n=1 Tax=Eutrema salsugineum TaxID=72664 RepID=UPI000CED21D7|nr:uncharacterized protein LOC112085505 [Eutrema salsugineum]XP_024010494.1 uncharacterized protein LOC112085505 [Eutrema salsugineum]XP_024010495.1 uncharacterized protein LOC112085505 [Eutrema salsugineum]XP_024010497.1 uncharacterized protein LOC112085505 [Eutrema salsugineum]XP_024010498.1 uncharacterized protein LOC112085505 [Eutrema salsugineum]XP_024010499.1 uncharacterized protein LOC112085505 [Eutrema salsugineum]XP_024010500.1 uncharacterized protein LOC112085505 [Eutrema salsugineu